MTVRVLRGRKMRTLQAMFDETAAALQFPYYFGENGAALTECLGDLSWLAPTRGFILLVQDSLAVLGAEPKGARVADQTDRGIDTRLEETLCEADRSILSSRIRMVD